MRRRTPRRKRNTPNGYGYSPRKVPVVAYSGFSRSMSNPRIVFDRRRSGLTRRTGSMRVASGPDAAGAAACAGWEGAGVVDGAGAFTGAAAASDFRAASATVTRRAISSTITAIDASKATVTAARTCSSSITATNGVADAVGVRSRAPGVRGASDARSFSAAAARG